MRLADLINSVDVPTTGISYTAWEGAEGRLRRRRRLAASAVTLSVIGALILGFWLRPLPAIPPAPKPVEPKQQGLTITRADGSSVLLSEASVTCLNDDGGRSVVLTAGNRKKGLNLRIQGGEGTLDQEATYEFPYERTFDDPSNFVVFVSERATGIEASSATETATGTASVTSTCSGPPTLEISIDGVLASELFGGEDVTISGNLSAVGEAATVESDEPTAVTGEVTAPRLNSVNWENMVDNATTIARDESNTADLSERPLDHAVLAISDPGDLAGVLVLGEDGWWRTVDAPGLEPTRDEDGYEGPALRPTSLSPDATKLALPQPDALVVVDLAIGTSERFATPRSLNSYAVWVDADHVLVGAESAAFMTQVTLTGKPLTLPRLSPQTAFLRDGTALTWTADKAELSTMYSWDDFTTTPTQTKNDGHAANMPPLATQDIAVGQTAINSRGQGTDDPPLGSGLVVLDRTTGSALAYQPMSTGPDFSQMLGWDRGLPIVGIVPETFNSLTMIVARWDWQNQTFEPIVVLPTQYVAWGRGWNAAQAQN